jgi:hypothetical protein
MLDEINQAGNELNIVVLDACRDNPFSWSRSGSRGLQVVGNQPADSIIVYATAAGATAADGTGRNGLFTSQLLNNLKTPGLEINEVFRRTGGDVARVSSGGQRPAVYNQFYGVAYLGARPSIQTTQPAPAIQPSVSPQITTTETIFVNEHLGRLTYSLSNNLDEIEHAIYMRTGRNIELDNVNWKLNTAVLSPNVKALMNKHNLNYSIAVMNSGAILVNKRIGNEWYFFQL